MMSVRAGMRTTDRPGVTPISSAADRGGAPARRVYLLPVPPACDRPSPFGILSRRRALGAAGAALGGLAGLGAWVRGCPPAVSGLRAIDAHEHRTLGALVEILFPPGERFGLDVPAMELPRAFDAFLADEPEENVADLRDAIAWLEVGPLLYGGSVTPFSRLPLEAREAHFRSWMESDELLRRQVALAFRKFFSLVFYDRQEVWPHIGYPGPSLGSAS